MSVVVGYDSKLASGIIAAHGAKPELLIQILHRRAPQIHEEEES